MMFKTLALVCLLIFTSSLALAEESPTEIFLVPVPIACGPMSSFNQKVIVDRKMKIINTAESLYTFPWGNDPVIIISAYNNDREFLVAILNYTKNLSCLLISTTNVNSHAKMIFGDPS